MQKNLCIEKKKKKKLSNLMHSVDADDETWKAAKEQTMLKDPEHRRGPESAASGGRLNENSIANLPSAMEAPVV